MSLSMAALGCQPTWRFANSQKAESHDSCRHELESEGDAPNIRTVVNVETNPNCGAD